MMRRALRVYADTSVFGGVFEEEFKAASRTFFDQVRAGLFYLVTSPLLEREMVGAPEQVRELYSSVLAIGEAIPLSPASVHLQEAYLEMGVVTPKWETDALHVAHATVTGCRIIVSWNFKHIVHFEKIALYNAVNAMEGYPEIRIHTPQEVIDYGIQDL